MEKPRYQIPVAVITTIVAVRKGGTKAHADHHTGVKLGMKMKIESTYHSDSFFVKRLVSIYANAPFGHEYPGGSRITQGVLRQLPPRRGTDSRTTQCPTMLTGTTEELPFATQSH